ncbi:hypothetical protein LEP1GSC090_0997 [Leptospira borgpetersenii serovar Javanica str. MK146]|nr:hypothetical protein LEP1GSC090_0997 [Leptospira borgpetersenii serovar Javanica str. MK146]
MVRKLFSVGSICFQNIFTTRTHEKNTIICLFQKLECWSSSKKPNSAQFYEDF